VSGHEHSYVGPTMHRGTHTDIIGIHG